MIETIYRVNGKEFYSKWDAEQYQKKIGKEVYCANCKEPIGIAEDSDDFKVNDLNFYAYFGIFGREDDIEPFGTKYLCNQCRCSFKNQLIVCKNLTEKLFDDFGLTKSETECRKTADISKNDLVKEILDLNNPESMLNEYLNAKEQEAKEWINENKREKN